MVVGPMLATVVVVGPILATVVGVAATTVVVVVLVGESAVVVVGEETVVSVALVLGLSAVGGRSDDPSKGSRSKKGLAADGTSSGAGPRGIPLGRLELPKKALPLASTTTGKVNASHILGRIRTIHSDGQAPFAPNRALFAPTRDSGHLEVSALIRVPLRRNVRKSCGSVWWVVRIRRALLVLCGCLEVLGFGCCERWFGDSEPSLGFASCRSGLADGTGGRSTHRSRVARGSTNSPCGTVTFLFSDVQRRVRNCGIPSRRRSGRRGRPTTESTSPRTGRARQRHGGVVGGESSAPI